MGKMLGAMDLTDPKKQASFTDAQAATAIKDDIKQNGKTTMKAFGGKLTDDGNQSACCVHALVEKVIVRSLDSGAE